jgi:hypothetical protein
MAEVHVLAIDLAKRSFQVCGTARGGAVQFDDVFRVLLSNVDDCKMQAPWPRVRPERHILDAFPS